MMQTTVRKKLIAAAVLSACASWSITSLASNLDAPMVIDERYALPEGNYTSSQDFAINVEGNGVLTVVDGGHLSNAGPLDIEVSGNNASALVVTGANAAAMITDSRLATTNPNANAHAVQVRNGATVTIDRSIIFTQGIVGRGVEVFNASATIRNSTIETQGNSSQGIYLAGGTSTRLALVDSHISTTGDASDGIYMVNRPTISLARSTITTLGKNALGIRALSGNVDATGLTILTTGENATAFVLETANALMRDSHLRTEGEAAAALSLKNSAQLDLYNTSATAAGVSAHALVIEGGRLHAGNSRLYSEQAAAIKAGTRSSNMLFSDGAQVGSGIDVLLEVDSSMMPGTDKVNLQFDSHARGVGDIIDSDPDTSNKVVDLALSNAAQWRGKTGVVDGLSIAGGAQWIMTGDSQINRLRLDDGHVAFAAEDGFKQLSVDTLSGSGLFELGIDPATALADQLQITRTASGEHRLLVRSSGSEGNKDVPIQLVHSNSGDAEFALANTGSAVDVGSYQYVLESGVDELTGATDWYLRGSDQLSETANGGVNTSDLAKVAGAFEMAALAGRMASLRNGTQGDHVWAASQFGRYRIDNGSGRRYTSDLAGLQAGVDRPFTAATGTWRLGVAANYAQVKGAFGNGSSGKTDSVGVAAYGLWSGDNGMYAELTGRTHLFYNKLDARATDGSGVHGQYASSGYGMSAEFGKQLEVAQNWFVTPQLHVDVMSLGGGSYRTSNGMRFQVDRSSLSSLRAGVLLSHAMAGTSGHSINPYLKVSAIADRQNGGRVYSNDNVFHPDISGARTEIATGIQADAGEHRRLSLDLTRSQGPRVTQPWGVNLRLQTNW